MYQNIQEIKDANRKLGRHWFSDSTTRAFRSRVYPTVYGGSYFVSSERMPERPRGYTVRQAQPDGSIRSASKFGEYPTLKAAKSAAQALVNGE